MNPVVRRMTPLRCSLRQCLCMGPARIQCEGKWKGPGANVGGHTFPLFHQMGSFLSVFPDVLSALRPCLQPGNPAQPQGSKDQLFSKHIAPAYFEGHVEPRFGGGKRTRWILLLFGASWIAPACLWGNTSGALGCLWCPGSSGEHSLPQIGVLSPDSLSHWIQARPEAGILNDAQRIISTRFFLFGAWWLSICIGKGYLKKILYFFLINSCLSYKVPVCKQDGC